MSKDLINIVDAIKDISKSTSESSGIKGGMRTAKALTYGATRIKMLDTDVIIEGDKLYRSCTVKNLEAGYNVIVAVTDGGQKYYVIDRLL